MLQSKDKDRFPGDKTRLQINSYWKLKVKVPVSLISPGPEVIKLFSCSTQMSTKFQLLIKTKIRTNEEVSCFKSVVFIMLTNFKMPTIVGILTFMSRINFVLSWVEHGRSFIISGLNQRLMWGISMAMVWPLSSIHTFKEICLSWPISIKFLAKHHQIKRKAALCYWADWIQALVAMTTYSSHRLIIG